MPTAALSESLASCLTSLATTAKDVPGWDSIVHITLVIEIEREFNVKFRMAEIEKLRNVGDLVAILAAKQPQS